MHADEEWSVFTAQNTLLIRFLLNSDRVELIKRCLGIKTKDLKDQSWANIAFNPHASY